MKVAVAKKASARIELFFPNEGVAGAVYRSLKPEEAMPKETKCRATIERGKNVLCLEIEADDTAALRAALNSFLRLASVARDMIKRRD